MKSAIGQTAQKREQRFVRAGMHPPNFTWLGGTISKAIKNPLFGGGGFEHRGCVCPKGMNKESDDDLLSQANAYYHWRGSVSPSCSGWEGVVPLCYGRQTKGWGRRVTSIPHSDCLVGCLCSRLRVIGRRCWVEFVPCIHTALLLKIIGSSLTGN